MSGAAQTLAAVLDGSAPDTIALMRVLAEAATEAEAREALDAANTRAEAAGDHGRSERLARIAALWAAHPQAWGVVRGTIGGIAHQPASTDPDAVLAYWAAAFDRLVATAPEASVALYSLGSPALLAAATAEIVDRMDEWGLLGLDRDVLDLGCGIGRFVAALAPRVRSVVGLDIAPGMVAEARRRCATLPNVRLARSDGRDLATVADGTVDLVLAADVFPYLVAAGGALVAVHVAEAARVLRPGGALLVLNYSYRGDLAADRSDLHRLAAEAFAVERDGTAAFTLWDAATFLLRRRPQA